MNKDSKLIKDVSPPTPATANHSVRQHSIDILARATALEAKMPQTTPYVSRGEKLLGIIWIVIGIFIVCTYIGIPFASVANAIKPALALDCLFAAGIIIGVVFIVIDILRQTGGRPERI